MTVKTFAQLALSLGSIFTLCSTGPAYSAMMDTLEGSVSDLRPDQSEKKQFFRVNNDGFALIPYDEFDPNSTQFDYQKQDAISSPIAVEIIGIKPATTKQGKPFGTTVPSLAINKEEELAGFVEKWRASWSAKDIETYMGCYSKKFRNGSLDKKGWRKKKTYLNGKYDFIQITIDNIVIERGKDTANISFFQTYLSDLYQTSGSKNLELVKENDEWKIEKEY